MLTLSNFSMRKPPFRLEQARALEWLAQIHAASEATLHSWSAEERDAFAQRIRKLIQRCACGPDKIRTRYHAHADVGSFELDASGLYGVHGRPRGETTSVRSSLYSEFVNAYFEQEYRDERVAPSDLIHVTCTGYVSPSGAQRLVAQKGWGALTQVTHAYHMGCYAAFPALRIAAGQLSAPSALGPARPRRADIVHTELCSLHLDPSAHSAEQCVVQSLFADGLIRYSVQDAPEPQSGLELLALAERILPESEGSMAWAVGDFGMHMTLSRDVPERIAGELRPFVAQLIEKAGLELGPTLKTAQFAVHPGGPKIIDGVQTVLELSDEQIRISRDVLFDHGNMSSATLPHVWMRMLSEPDIARGATIVSLAFGPGLTICGGVFRKR